MRRTDFPSPPVVLVTGASSGLGRACAAHLHRLGWRVTGTSRQPADHPAVPFPLLALDVTDEQTVQRTIDAIVTREGRLDVVVNNAGYALAGAVEDTSLAEAQAQIDTNFFGVLRVCRAALPVMREQRSGTLINISSLAGLFGLPFQALYSASKFALEGMTEALRMEVRPFGIRVVLVEPGDFCTPMTDNRRWTQAAQHNPTYRARAERAVAVMAHDEQNGAPPERVAYLVERIVRARSPRLRYTVGPLPQRAAALLRRWLPHSLVERGLMAYYQVDRE